MLLPSKKDFDKVSRESDYFIVHPTSTISDAPVMKSASADARKVFLPESQT
jgi:hypothetical protein